MQANKHDLIQLANLLGAEGAKHSLTTEELLSLLKTEIIRVQATIAVLCPETRKESVSTAERLEAFYAYAQRVRDGVLTKTQIKDVFGGAIEGARQPDAAGHYWVGIGTAAEHCMRCMLMPRAAAATCPGTPGVAQQFYQLRHILNQETSGLSGGREKHWAYQQIIGLGQAVVPLLLAELRDDPDWWGYALFQITGENPVPDEHAGRLLKIAADWLKWGEEQGIVLPRKESGP